MERKVAERKRRLGGTVWEGKGRKREGEEEIVEGKGRVVGL